MGTRARCDGSGRGIRGQDPVDVEHLSELEFLGATCPLQDTLEEAKKAEFDDYDEAFDKFEMHLRVGRCLNKGSMLKSLLRYSLSVVTGSNPNSLMELAMDKVVEENLPPDMLPRTLVTEVMNWPKKKERDLRWKLVMLDILVFGRVMSIL